MHKVQEMISKDAFVDLVALICKVRILNTDFGEKNLTKIIIFLFDEFHTKAIIQTLMWTLQQCFYFKGDSCILQLPKNNEIIQIENSRLHRELSLILSLLILQKGLLLCNKPQYMQYHSLGDITNNINQLKCMLDHFQLQIPNYFKLIDMNGYTSLFDGCLVHAVGQMWRVITK